MAGVEQEGERQKAKKNRRCFSIYKKTAFTIKKPPRVNPGRRLNNVVKLGELLYLFEEIKVAG